jgi:hypothetical protein
VEHPSAAVIDTSCCPRAEAEDIARALVSDQGMHIVMAPAEIDKAVIARAMRSAIGAPWRNTAGTVLAPAHLRHRPTAELAADLRLNHGSLVGVP